jgi:putative two-component system response regulator
MFMMCAEILIIDDETINLQALRNALVGDFTVKACKSGEAAYSMLLSGLRPDLILLDISMPEMDGYETLERIYSLPEFKNIPIIFVTALDSNTDEEKGFQMGVVDYIIKPIRPAIVLERVKVHLELKAARDALSTKNQWLEEEVERRVSENQLIQEATLDMISQLIETRDFETGNHINRTKLYVEILARRLKKHPKYAPELTEENIQRIVKASVLHDIGKIGIPDMVLMKPTRLKPEEFELMKSHCSIGAKAIQKALGKYFKNTTGYSPEEKPSLLIFFEEAIRIIMNHHEKWDGTGYPFGVKGEAIPLSARMMTLADIFDALTTRRVYKEAWSFESAVEWITSNSGIFFDPEIIEAFIADKDAFHEVLTTVSDDTEEHEIKENLWEIGGC